jgi:hypothetical protein
MLLTFTEMAVIALARLYLGCMNAVRSADGIRQAQGAVAILWTSVLSTPVPAVCFNVVGVLNHFALQSYQHTLQLRPTSPRRRQSFLETHSPEAEAKALAPRLCTRQLSYSRASGTVRRRVVG